jgi:hypothetical protein
MRLLEELRALTNISVSGTPLVSLVLAGSPILEERFADPQLDMFSQRIAARCYLSAMGREETLQYVRSQVAAAGMKPEKLFEAEALEAIYSAPGGVPRLVNQLGDQAVWMAEATGCQPLDAALVQQAWGELQQLPAPWNTEQHASPGASSASAEMVEFGELDGAFVDDINHRGPRASLPVRRPAHVEDVEDELPASIPIARALGERDGKDLGEFHAALDATQEILDAYDELDDAIELAPLPPAQPPGPPPAVNPFDESFGDEEVLVDRYRDFELHMLRRAPQVRNRRDPEFASALGRADDAYGVKSLKPGVEIVGDRAATLASGAKVIAPAVKLAVAPFSDKRQPASDADLLVIEDDRASGMVVPGQQFRRLFSRLESGGLRAQ